MKKTVPVKSLKQNLSLGLVKSMGGATLTVWVLRIWSKKFSLLALQLFNFANDYLASGMFNEFQGGEKQFLFFLSTLES